MTEKECEACEKNRKGVYATPFGADHHHARIAELEQERDSMEVSRDLAEAEELKTRKERDSAQASLRSASAANARLSKERNQARAVIRSVIADLEINGSLPNYALNRLRLLLDSSESPPRAEACRLAGEGFVEVYRIRNLILCVRTHWGLIDEGFRVMRTYCTLKWLLSLHLQE